MATVLVALLVPSASGLVHDWSYVPRTAVTKAGSVMNVPSYMMSMYTRPPSGATSRKGSDAFCVMSRCRLALGVRSSHCCFALLRSAEA